MTCKSETSNDFGAEPGIVNMHSETLQNQNFRTVLWTGKYMQLTVMSIPIGGEIGLELHENLDQFIRVEGGCANVYMGKAKRELKFVGKVNPDYGIIVPAGTWHNIINACPRPLKVYSVYAPPKHPFATVHPTKLDADLAED